MVSSLSKLVTLTILAVLSIDSLKSVAQGPTKAVVCRSGSIDGGHHSSFYDCLRSRLVPHNTSIQASSLVLPNQPAFSLSTLTYNLAIRHNASAIVYPSSSADVSAAIKCAASFGVPVVGRSGGHSYASFSTGEGALVIDVTNLKQFQLESNQTVGAVGELVKIGTGLRIGDLELALKAHDRALAHGLCPYIGVSGHALCGGFGAASRMWGLFHDQVTEMEVVTAAGEILTVSEMTYPDLFFALRGAGPSFGIVTSMTLRTEAAPRTVIQFHQNYRFPNAAAAAEAFLHFQSWSTDSAPPELGIRWSIGIVRPENSSEPVILNWQLRGNFYGHFGRFERVIRTLTDGLKYARQDEVVERVTWFESVGALANNVNLSSVGMNPSRNNATYYAKSFVVRESELFSYPQWLTLTSALFDRPTHFDTPTVHFVWFLEIDLLGGSYEAQPTGVKKFSGSRSSYGPRDGLLLFQMGSYGPKGATLKSGSGMDLPLQFANLVYGSLGGGQRELSGFSCYVDPRLSADGAHREYFGSNTTQLLKKIKSKWDPCGVFKYPHSF